MKNIYYLLFCLLMLSACQDEEDIEVINNENGLSANSALTNNLKRLTQNPTAFDNFIDNSSKISVDFPFEVTVNSTDNVSLNTDADYQNLIAILEATPEEDVIELNFPVSVSQVNYLSQTIGSQNELTNFLTDLPASDEVNCVEFIYPFSIQFFDASNSFIDTQNVNNRAQLFNFLNELAQNNFFYQIEYPIEADVEGTSVLINSNAEFNTTFNTLSQACFEPLLFENIADGGGGGEEPLDIEALINFVTDGDFQVTLLTDDGENNTEFEGIIFNFNPDNNIIADGQQVGEWIAFIEDDAITFELDFDDSDFGELDDDWEVVSFEDNTLTLIDESSDGDSTDLVFTKN